MAPISLEYRALSQDNTINIIFGILGSIIGILSLGLGWLMWKERQVVHLTQGLQEPSLLFLLTFFI